MDEGDDPIELPPLTHVVRAGDGPEPLLEREWLVTDGRGGYSAGTLLGVPTRRHHALLVAALATPTHHGRHVLLAALDEELGDATDAHDGGACVRLAGPEREHDGVPRGAVEALREFSVDYLVPTWLWQWRGALLEKQLVRRRDAAALIVRWRLLEGGPVRLRLRPWFDFRGHEDELEPGARPLEHACEAGPHGTVHRVRDARSALALRLALRGAAADFDATSERLERVPFRLERERGYASVGGLASPGAFAVRLQAGESIALLASADDAGLDADPEDGIRAEQRRVRGLLAAAPRQARSGVAAQLVAASDQFLIVPPARGADDDEGDGDGHHDDDAPTDPRLQEPPLSVIAGYPWFGDWGRDTMIALEGLTLCTGRPREARRILATFGSYVRDGLLPNLFPDGRREALYHTVDATLWYFHALDRYVACTGDHELVDALWPTLESIVEHHRRGTRFGIGVDDADGLLRAGAEGYQLTWMDAKVDDWVVTPRRGKPVEIQALWYNALELMAEWSAARGAAPAAHRAAAARVRESFAARYWNAARGCLYDVVDGEDGDDGRVRPNQVFAISLPRPVLAPARWRAVLERVDALLATPVGLRTLSADDADYRPTYAGSLRERDAAYHQGTIWPWLLGHYVDAWRKTWGDGRGARGLVAALPEHLLEFGIGSVAEIFDAEPPHRPRGCPAQAWSVAELLRAWLATERDDGPARAADAGDAAGR